MPDGMPPLVTGFEDSDTLESVARAIFAARNDCNIGDVDNLLAHPDLEQQFDTVMDQLAIDPLEDAVDWVGLDASHLTAPVRVFDITGDPRTYDVIESHLFCYAPEKGE